MFQLSSLGDEVSLLEVFKTFPAVARPLIALHEVVMRDPSPLSVGDRELIAAYVSGLNGCTYCHGVHAATAAAFGIDPAVFEALMADTATAPVEARLKPLLDYVRKVTLTPSRIIRADAEAVYAAGWPEAALHDAVAVCALFNLMNRYVDGLGVSADQTYTAQSAARLHDGGYAGLLAHLPA